MISLKLPRETDAVEKAETTLAVMHLGLRRIIKPGISSWKIEGLARKYFKAVGAEIEQIGFEGYKYATCVSINDEICYGFPHKKLILKKSDLVKVDTAVGADGTFSNSCWSYAIGEVSPEIQKLMDVTKRSLFMGTNQCVPGNRIGDIGAATRHHIKDENGYGDVREFVGHGIQLTMHEDPTILHYGEHGQGIRLHNGMTVTVEPMTSTGTWEADTSGPSGWLTKTASGGWSYQYEHTLAITNNGSKTLTLQGPEVDADYMYDDNYVKCLDHYHEITEKAVKQLEN